MAAAGDNKQNDYITSLEGAGMTSTSQSVRFFYHSYASEQITEVCTMQDELKDTFWPRESGQREETSTLSTYGRRKKNNQKW